VLFLRLKYLNLENNEIASIPHLRLLGARVRQKDNVVELDAKQTAQENTPTQSKQPEEVNVVDEEGKEAAEEDKEGLILDEVDEILNKKLPGEDDGEGGGMRIRHRASTVTEDASLLGTIS